MKTLDDNIARYTLLKNDVIDDNRFDAFYAQCAELPIEYLKKALSLHQREADQLEDSIIPEQMIEENRRSVETSDGTKVTIRTEINASLSGIDDLEPIAQWLTDRGMGGIVKRQVVELKIHTGQLKKNLKEYYDKTNELPSDIINVSMFNHAVIKRNKENDDDA